MSIVTNSILKQQVMSGPHERAVSHCFSERVWVVGPSETAGEILKGDFMSRWGQHGEG